MKGRRPPHANDSIFLLALCALFHFAGRAIYGWTQASWVMDLAEVSWPLAAIGLAWGRGIDPIEGYSLRLPSWRWLAYTVLLAVSMVWVLKAWLPVQDWILRGLGGAPEEEYRTVEREIERMKSVGVDFAIFAAAMWAPVREELIFRGLGLSGMARTYGAGFAIFFTSAAFGIFHESIGRALITGILGATFAVLVLGTRSLWCGILAHAINNLFALFVTRDPPAMLTASAAVTAGLTLIALRHERIRTAASSDPPPA